MYGTGSDAGTWNDYVCTDDRVDAYIVEYGGLGGTATVEATTTLTITSTESTAGFTIFDVELKTMIKAQIEGANRSVSASTEPILGRINQPRKKIKHNKKSKKNKKNEFNYVKFNLNLIEKKYPKVLKKWDIDFNKTYTYDAYIKLFSKLDKNNQYTLLSFLPITEYIYYNNENNSENLNQKIYSTLDDSWSTWSAGSITISEKQFKIGSLGRKSESDSITFGVDRAIGTNGLLGLAYRTGRDNTDISKQGTKLLIKSENLTAYTSWKNINNNGIDLILGSGHLNNDLTRKETSSLTNKITGSRTADQIYGILNFTLQEDLDQLSTIYYTRVEEAYTKFYAYNENSNDSAAHFKDQHLRTSILSIGTLLNYRIAFKNGNKLTPNALFEYASDESNSSKAVAYYLSDPSSVYTYEVENDVEEIYKLGAGFDVSLLNSWNINTKLLRKKYKDYGNESIYEISAVKSF